MSEYVFLNGEILESKDAKIHISDLALLRGYGVFDYFRVIDGKPIFLEDYLDRFERSVAGLNLILPYSREFLKVHIFELIRLNTHPLLGIRLVCSGGYASDAYSPTAPNVFMIAKPFSFLPYDQGLKLMTADFQRELHQIKSINYLQPISLLPKMKACGADDVIYVHNGLVSESSRSNVFIVKNNVLITPDAGILEGVTRKKILSFATEILPLEVRSVHLEEVKNADEIFLSASTKRISPVTQIDDLPFESGPWTKLLYDRLIEEENK